MKMRIFVTAVSCLLGFCLLAIGHGILASIIGSGIICMCLAAYLRSDTYSSRNLLILAGFLDGFILFGILNGVLLKGDEEIKWIALWFLWQLFFLAIWCIRKTGASVREPEESTSKN